ncbi:alpha/beta hydrolase [Candidatus Woesearchaeota archaeon]|nr:MAG: alpha/beta hydrolase [Candidatus Woesearchaeota archaeon]
MAIIHSFDNAVIYYDYVRKEEPVLIFLHGLIHNHTIWKKEVDFFSEKEFSTLSVDLRGHGKSEVPLSLSAFKIENFANDVHEIIKKENIKHFILIGHSLGGMVILKFLELYPHEADKAVLIDSGYENPWKSIEKYHLTPLLDQFLSRLFENKKLQKKYFHDVDFSKFDNKYDVYYWLQGLKGTSLQTVVACFKGIIDLDEKHILPNIAIPVLLIHGDKDNKIPLREAISMKQHIKNSKLVILRNASHDTPLFQAEKINKAVASFLEN